MSNVVNLEVVDRARSEATRLLAKRLKERQTAELAATLKNRARRLTRMRTFWASFSLLSAAAATAVGYQAGTQLHRATTQPTAASPDAPAMPTVPPQETTARTPAAAVSTNPESHAQSGAADSVSLPAGIPTEHPVPPPSPGPDRTMPGKVQGATLPTVPLPARQRGVPPATLPSGQVLPVPTAPPVAAVQPKPTSGVYERSALSDPPPAPSPEKAKSEDKQLFQVVGVPDDQMMLIEVQGTVKPVKVGSKLPDGKTLKKVNPATGAFEAQ